MNDTILVQRAIAECRMPSFSEDYLHQGTLAIKTVQGMQSAELALGSLWIVLIICVVFSLCGKKPAC